MKRMKVVCGEKEGILFVLNFMEEKWLMFKKHVKYECSLR